jgi:hypothetical protein
MNHITRYKAELNKLIKEMNFNGDSSSGFEEDIYNKDGYIIYKIDTPHVYLVQIQVYIFSKRCS